MQETVKLFIKLCTEIIEGGSPVYEFGSLQVNGQEGFADLRPFFRNRQYIGCDMRSGLGVDQVENLETGLSIESESAGLVLCLETLEHVFDIFKAIAEMRRILRDEGGVLIISSVFNYPIHSYPSDYWRFTPQCFLRLLSDFDISLILGQGSDILPTSILGIGVKTKNKNEWKTSLLDISKKYELELVRNFSYDTSVWRGIKLGFYKKFNQKKYASKMYPVQMSWVINEKQ